MPKSKDTTGKDADIFTITRELFANGGPQLASYPHKTRSGGPVFIKRPFKHKPCPALLAEQQRLIRTWNRKERRKKKQPVINRKEGKK